MQDTRGNTYNWQVLDNILNCQPMPSSLSHELLDLRERERERGRERVIGSEWEIKRERKKAGEREREREKKKSVEGNELRIHEK